MVVTQAAGQGQLPAETNEFVGRTAELRQIDGLLRDAQLVTLVGPGGVGKTRVALRAAWAAAPGYPDGAWFAELSGLRDPELLPHTIAHKLGLPEQSAGSQRDALLAHLRDHRLLLILDTCEHLIDACAELAGAIIAEAPGVTLLATSREPLDVAGETTLPIAPLPVPGRAESGAGTNPFWLLDGSVGGREPHSDAATAPGTAGAGDAVELFALRAAAAVPGFTITDANRAEVIALCGGLEGIPLLIELAAGRLRTLSLTEINKRLAHRLALLTGGPGGPGDRHATARNAVAWSYAACTPPERALWARLSVFPGSFDADCVYEVCASGDLSPSEIFETIIRLVDKNVLIRADAEGTEDGQAPRFRMLDTLREYGAERLAASADEAAIRNRLIARYLAMARYFDEHVFDDDQLVRFGELRREHANIRAALEYSLGGQPAYRERDGAELVTSLWAYWLSSGLMVEGLYWLGKVLDRFTEPSRQRMWALVVRSYVGSIQGIGPQAVADGCEGVELAATLKEPLAEARGYAFLVIAHAFVGQLPEAAEAAKKAKRLLGPLRDQVGAIIREANLCYVYQGTGDLEKAIACYQRGIALFGDSAERWYHGYLHIVGGLGYFLYPGKDAECAQTFQLALMAKYELDEVTGTAYSLEALGWLASRAGRHERAAWLLGAAGPLWERCGARLGNVAAFEQLHQQAAAASTAALGEDTFTALSSAGRRHPLDQVVALAVNDADALGDRVPGPAHPGVLTLTHREREIAYLAVAGLSVEQIARQLFMPGQAVTASLASVFGKLGVSSADQLRPWLGEKTGPPGAGTPALSRGKAGKRP